MFRRKTGVLCPADGQRYDTVLRPRPYCKERYAVWQRGKQMGPPGFSRHNPPGRVTFTDGSWGDMRSGTLHDSTGSGLAVTLDESLSES